MGTRLKSIFSPFVPAHVSNPLRLARRMICSGNRAALFTLFVTVLGILCIPLDLLLSFRERRIVSAAAATPARPAIFVCGPARSGTTLAFQVLCQHLDVCFPRNITALFPRSPISISKIHRRFARPGPAAGDQYQNYYGKTSGMSSPSEANHIWNRWVQPDSTGFRTILSPAGAREAARFFAAFSGVEGKAVISKNNNMNVFADVIAAAMPNALIVCLRRSPEFLAQSLLQARRDIHGSVARGYGVQDAKNGAGRSDPVASVCAQVAYLERAAREMRSRIGEDRFWIVDYEEFCRSPGELVTAISSRLGLPMAASEVATAIEPIPARNVVRDEAEFLRIRQGLVAAGVIT